MSDEKTPRTDAENIEDPDLLSEDELDDVNGGTIGLRSVQAQPMLDSTRGLASRVPLTSRGLDVNPDKFAKLPTMKLPINE